jgi:hypothetical protein
MLTTGIAYGVSLLIIVAAVATARAAISRGERWPPWNPFRHPPAPRLSMGLTAALTALICLAALPPLVREYENPKDFLTFGQATRPGGLMGFLKALPGPAVILAGEALSPKLPALTGHYVVATAYSHDPVPDWPARQALVRAALSEEGAWEEIAPGLRGYGVGYVVAESGEVPVKALRRLDAHPEMMNRCYEGEGCIVWRVGS